MLYKTSDEMLLEALGVGEADSKQVEKLLSQFRIFAQQCVFDLILASLPDESATQFLLLLDEDETGEQALVFARSHIQDLDTKIATRIQEEIARIKNP